MKRVTDIRHIRSSVILCFLLVFSFTYYANGQYREATSWPRKLKKRIKNRPLSTLEGTALTANGDVLRTYASTAKPENTHKAAKGLYFLQLDVCRSNSIDVSCFPDQIGNCTEQKFQLVTSKLLAPIEDGDCLLVTGAFDDLGIFVCLKVFKKETNVYVVNIAK